MIGFYRQPIIIFAMTRRKSPRRRSEEHYDARYRLNGAIPIISDEWLYEWSHAPPEAFLRHKVVFQPFTPADIDKNDWTVLKPAVKEISDSFGVQRPEVEREMPPEAEQISSNRFEWLSLNHFYKCPCLLGVCGEYVVAAAKLNQKRREFVPSRLYEAVRKHKDLKDCRYFAGYRHFQVKFTADRHFLSRRHQLPCNISYGLDIGVHGRGGLWAVLEVGGVFIPTPDLILLTGDISQLLEHIEQLNFNCQLFVQRLESMWLKSSGIEPLMRLIRNLSSGIVQHGVLESLKKNHRLQRCLTRFDVLYEVMREHNFKTNDQIPSLIPLAKNFVK